MGTHTPAGNNKTSTSASTGSSTTSPHTSSSSASSLRPGNNAHSGAGVMSAEGMPLVTYNICENGISPLYFVFKIKLINIKLLDKISNIFFFYIYIRNISFGQGEINRFFFTKVDTGVVQL